MYKLWGFFIVLLGVIGIFSLLVYRSIIDVSVQPIPPEAIEGKKVFQQKSCVECHTVFGNGGYTGGDLTKIYDRTDNEALRAYLAYPPILTGAKKKRHIQVNEQEATAIVDYLKYLSTIDTRDWPLKPTKRTNVE